MLDFTRLTIFAAAIGFAGALHAQDAPVVAEDAPAVDAPAVVEGDTATSENLSLGEEVGGIGSTYTKEVHGSWDLRCVRTEDGSDPCQLYQLLKDEQGNSVAEISMFTLPAGQPAVAGATLITPLETLLTQQIGLQIDGGAAKRYPFTWCSAIGCIARVGFTQEEVDQFKKGAKAVVTIVPVAAPDKKVELAISLSGFTAGYEAVSKENAAVAPQE